MTIIFILQILQWCGLFLVTANQLDGNSTIKQESKCGANGQQFKYLWGDAMVESTNCIGPNNIPYPTSAISRMFRKNWPSMSSRSGRASSVIDPLHTQRTLIKNYQLTNNQEEIESLRKKRDYNTRDVCLSNGASRLCKTRYNTTAPMYGVSLTSGQPVTIVQKFPDLLQQVIYEVCESSECDVVRGECSQTYVPYLFLVIPLGPVTLTGQDYVLVESGCVCKPRLLASTANEAISSSLPHL